MTATTEKSIERLREESERNREALAATVGEIRDRVGDTASEIKTLVSPSHIKQEIRDYVRQERESLVAAVQRKAKDNPLQVAAVAAAVAYFALSLLRVLPAPLWLIGAGLFLTSKRGQDVTNAAKARVDDVFQQGTETAADLASSIRSDLEDRITGVRYGAEELRDTISSAAGSTADTARAAFHDARDAAAGAVQDGTSKAKVAAEQVRSSIIETGAQVKKGAQDATHSSRYAVADFINNNALLVAGIGAAVGAVIAASIPPSDAENKLFGAGSEKLKSKAREAAAQGIEKVGEIAADTAGAVAATAAREGLDAAGVQDALNKVAGSVRSVADHGIDTALGNKQLNQSSQAFEQTSGERNPS